MVTETKNFFEAVEEYERRLIGEALAQVKGNQAKAARILGLKPTTLNSQIQRLGINARAYREVPPVLSMQAFEKFVLWKSGRPVG